MKPDSGTSNGNDPQHVLPEFREFIPSFMGSAREHVDAIDQGLLQLEKDDPAAKDVIKHISRNAHSLKGAAMTIGIHDMADLCHHMEDVLREIKEDRIENDARIFDLLFEINDANKAMLENLSAPSTPSVDLDPLLRSIEIFLFSKKGDDAAPAPDRSREMIDSTRSSKRITSDSVRVPTKKVDRFLNIAVELVITRNRLHSFFEKLDQLKEAQIKEQSDLKVVCAASKNPLAGPSAEALFFEALKKRNLEGQTLMAQFAEGFHDSLETLSRLVDETQQLVMDIRMLPISLLFSPFSRAVRDLAKEQNKRVDLIIEGEETLIDKQAIEELSDPLLHLLRNAIDHGMESTEDRKATQKPETGKILLRAFQDIDKVVIEVTDDGPGIDRNRIMKKALEKKFLTEEASKHMLDAEVFDLLFLPGFSTAKVVTELSGRGVGMDVVKTNVEKLNGSVEISSTLGKGTLVRIALPLTLATTRAFLVRCASHIFAVPIFSAIQMLRVTPKSIQTVKGREAIYWQGEILPCARLDATLSFHESPSPPSHEKICLLLLKHGGKKIAFQVDEVIGVEEIVMRNLGSHLGRLPVFSGSSILGTGDIALIIDVSRLFTAAQIKAGNIFLEKGRLERHSARQQRILVVEDQMTTRLLEKSILEAAGFLVETAEDGVSALEKMDHAPFDLIITDVQMPRMDGFTLTENLKKDERFRHIPLIIVTSLENEEERKQGLLAGADAFLLKKSFNQESLIESIRALIG